MKCLSNTEINTGRQFEFDLAKAICIFGMVFVHCFERLASDTMSELSIAYYIAVVVLDVIFGAGTFMACMGLGIAYSRGSTPSRLMKRGVLIFSMGYGLNFVRAVLPLLLFGKYLPTEIETKVICLLSNDILMFAGLALMLFGFLKKLRLPDWAILALALLMSVVGSFVRFIDVGAYWLNILAGNFIAAMDSENTFCSASFPLMNWFIIVVAGYLWGKFLRRCKNLEKYYAVTLPVSGVILAVYMAIAIPNRLGMMCGDLNYYYELTTPDAIIILMGAVFATGLYHYIAKLLPLGLKRIITRLSININGVYCIHWIIIGWLNVILSAMKNKERNAANILIMAMTIYLVSNALAEGYRRLANRIGVKK